MYLERKDHKDILESRKKTILALSQTKDIGYYSIRRLYVHKKDLEDIKEYELDELIILFKKAGIRYSDRIAHNFFINKVDLFNKAENIYKDLVKRNICLILEDESLFPSSLKIIPDNPYWLFVEGNPNILNSQNIVAVVGTRNPTEKGIKIAKELTEFLVNKGYIIVSGLAQGIDEASHNITNELGGKGIAVLGCGINLPFPAKTYRIRKALKSNSGAIVSEYMINDSYSKKSFYWRNRIQSGLSKAVFPIQGSLKSGTAHTVKFAEVQKKKIIGVYLDDIEPVFQNELFNHFRNKGFPIINIRNELNKISSIIEKPPKKIDSFEQVSLFKLKDEEEIKIYKKEKRKWKDSSIFRLFSKLIKRK